MNRKLPRAYKVPPGNVLVQLEEASAFSNIGFAVPSSDREDYNMWVRVKKVGGNWFQRLWVYLTLGFKDGDVVRTKRSIENPFDGNDGEKYLVIFQEDVNLIR